MVFAVIAFSHMVIQRLRTVGSHRRQAATAIGLFGLGSDTALAEVVGMLVEVRVMRSIFHIIKAAKP
ncbi:hypothetical protein JHL17_05700 [Azospirillum sp. YIM B02556]|uniref:Uncharacterized protein n=1 Tax=Azospirillum endophyticum TaxID=2800326 RepID=A0ABS1F0G2_9PROT|nr:hypothetical protein [Azospirillum endophyticum]MBK1836901.1 hypothetical protein [Azospirillum endophyticum]